jgi:hypothetical protein
MLPFLHWADPTREPGAKAAVPRPEFFVNSTICMNRKCPGYGRVIYTGATRCVFCKWDLKAAQRRIEMPAEASGSGDTPGLAKRSGGEDGI